MLEVAWDDVTRARAPGRLPGNAISSSFPFPPTSARSSAPVPCRLFPLSFPLALASCRWETLAWSLLRGRGAGVVWPERLCPFAGLRGFWVIFFFFFLFLACHRQTPSPASCAPRTPTRALGRVSSRLYFPTCCMAQCRVALSHPELKRV